MTMGWHDPLCALYSNDYCCDDCYRCECHLIERVREDERKREAERRAKEFGVWHDDQRSLP